MKTTFASLLAAILPALAIGQGTGNPSGNPSDDYSKQPLSISCNNIKLREGRYLDGDCLEPPSWPEHGTASSELDLNGCLANYGGSLSYARPGGFADSCSDCVVHVDARSATLACECSKGQDKGTAHSEWDLEEWHYIQNTNGQLTCYHYQD
ncbi:hypothetical protein F4821DRAFT_255542 [Hypoxylon rubiginosum]|uniref:Uncharacterized protein n=1 Tax=Hypoxylon rubiginosum TaxID=110542 RepID=A0ACC0DDY7_9PEZI|nr:hypothetical protein F4821DRAFT_255542 [Hypoxylon rubiginosum]